jgi:hypothetical protein
MSIVKLAIFVYECHISNDNFFGSMTQERKTETKRERPASSYFTNIFKSRHSTLTSQRR